MLSALQFVLVIRSFFVEFKFDSEFALKIEQALNFQ